MATDQRFVHDANRDAVTRIAVVEGPARENGKIESLEVRGAHDLVVGRRTLAFLRLRVACDLERPLAGVRRAQRQRARPSDAAHAGKSPDLALDGFEEMDKGCWSWVTGTQRVHHHRKNALGTIPAVDAVHYQEGAQQQTGAKEQNHRGGNLSDNEHASDCRAASCDNAATGGDYLVRRKVGGLPRGGESKQQPDQKRRHDAESRDTPVEGERNRPGQQFLRNQRRRDFQNRGTHPEA